MKVAERCVRLRMRWFWWGSSSPTWMHFCGSEHLTTVVSTGYSIQTGNLCSSKGLLRDSIGWLRMDWAKWGRKRAGFCWPGRTGLWVITSKVTLKSFFCNYNIFHFPGAPSMESKRLILFHENSVTKLLEISTD